MRRSILTYLRKSACCSSKASGACGKVKSAAKTVVTESKVPATRFGRIAHFGYLGINLGARQVFRRLSGGQSSIKLNETDLNQLVDALCQARGAALKLGQMISLLDDTFVSPQVQSAFERVRSAAHSMPRDQTEQVLQDELGPDWSERLFSEFEFEPFATASIGEVHRARLRRDGRQVAVKIQYPGVAQSINSDLNNLIMISNYLNILPKGMFAEKLANSMKVELAWECNYTRESAALKKFKQLLADHEFFSVPDVIDEASTSRVLTVEYVEGKPLDDCVNESQDVRNQIGEELFWLSCTEIMRWRFMQTDPNWSNFLYSAQKRRLFLIDFGASRQFDERFIYLYNEVLHAAMRNDSEAVLRISTELGFLTGKETNMMRDTHVKAVLTLGEMYRTEKFDFGRQITTRQIHDLVPTMMKHRLTPPPEQTYSLHRKLAGCFLICAKLSSVVRCRQIFLDVYNSSAAKRKVLTKYSSST